MDIVGLHERALDETARLVDGVRSDHMGLPTPCSDWDVRALLTHIVGGNVRYAGLARGESMRQRPAPGGNQDTDLLGDDPASAFAAPVPVEDDLPEIDRLAAFLGRTP